MAGAGFEPAKAEPWRLQRHPFDRSGTPPRAAQSSDQAARATSKGRSRSTSNAAYFGPPSKSPDLLRHPQPG